MGALQLIVLLAVAQAAMPGSLRDDLLENPKKALATLKRNPNLVNSKSKELGDTPLHFAASLGHTDLVRWLVAHGARVSAKGFNGFTPLHLARTGTIASILVKAKADLRDVADVGMTPMQYAAQDVLAGNGARLGVVTAIRQAGVPLDLLTALCIGKRDAAKAMIQKHPDDVGKHPPGGRTALHIVARQGDIEIAKLLLAAGMKVDVETGMTFRGRVTPLVEAVWARRTAMVKFLCESGADPNKVSERLDDALMGQDSEIARIVKQYAALRKKGG